MKIIDVKSLVLPDVKVIRFARFNDSRGYFTETYRRSDLNSRTDLEFFKKIEFLQVNESYSIPGVMRGLHFQWNPYMGKLIRVISGMMYDMFLDIRKGSPSFGKIVIYEMPSYKEQNYSEWIWLPPGFAHGIFFTEESVIEYFCSGEYSPGCEAGISPLSQDLDWSLCDKNLKNIFDEFTANNIIISDKDKNGFSLTSWGEDSNSDNFIYRKM